MEGGPGGPPSVLLSLVRDRADNEPMTRRRRSIARRLAGDESGMTLPEVLISMSIFVVLLFAILQLLDTTTAVAPKDTERNDALHEAQVGVHRMVRELRQANDLNGQPTASRMNARVPAVDGPDRYVLIDCAQPSPRVTGLNACRRITAPVSGPVPTDASAGEVIVDRVIDPNVFSYSPDATGPRFVRLKVQVPASGERKTGYGHRLTLDDGFFLRNLTLLG
jgi:prepilin-type N-terminal cleavage/methylation domain-containing protein